MIRVWQGFHSEELSGLIRHAWEKEELLIVCSPAMKDLSFVDFLRTQTYPDKPILGVFTSGTSGGSPRLVLYSKRNIESSLQGIRSFFETNRFDTLFCYPQPFHTFGLVLGYVHAAIYGLKLVTGEGRYSRSFHSKRVELHSHSVLTLGTPTHFHDLLKFTRSKGIELVPSYSCIVGGAKVSAPLWYLIRDALHIEAPSVGYRASEACPGVTHQSPGEEPRESGEIGRAIPGVSTRIVPGEGFEFSGANVCMAIVQDGRIEFPKQILLRDEIRCREDGVLIYEGRTDLVLNRGGQKFSLERIEETIRGEIDIETICVTLPDDRLGEELGILVRERSKKASIYSLLQKEFGQSFDPTRYIEVEQFPLNESLKIDRKRGTQLLLDL